MKSKLNQVINCILIMILILLTVASSYGEYNTEILFRNLPWGSSAKFVNNEMRKDGMGLSLSDPDITGVQLCKQLISDRYGMWTMESGVTAISITNNPPINVAGYKPLNVSMLFVYRPQNNKIVVIDEYAALYAGVYTFEPQSMDKMFADLKGKLTLLYGKCKYEGDDKILDSLFGERTHYSWGLSATETFAIWETESEYLILTGKDYPDDNDSVYYSDAIQIVYFTKHGDEWIQDAIVAKNAEKMDDEKQRYNNGNTNGL